jgi:hypothetical protein
MQLRAERAITDALKRLRPKAEVINGRVANIEDNLLSGIHRSQFESDFRSGAGGELEDKVRAPFSSSASTANASRTSSRFGSTRRPKAV